MSIRRLAWIALTVAVLLASVPTSVAQANVAAPPERMAFEFFDEALQPMVPTSMQLAGCSNQGCQEPVTLFQLGVCDIPGCLASPDELRLPRCTQNTCFVEAFEFTYPYYKLILLPPSQDPAGEALSGEFEGRPIGYGQVRGLRVVVTPSGVVITEDAELATRIPGGSSGYCTPSPAMIGFAITQVSEVLAAFLLLLLLGTKLRLIGGVLMAMGLINFATYPVVWYTFPALGPSPTTQAQAVAVLTLLAALLYAGLLVRLRPAFDPALRRIFVGLLAVGLPMATVLIFGVATAASAAIDAVGVSKAVVTGAGLPFRVTMPASEVFAFAAEALLIAVLCRPAVSARQAVLVSVVANSASLALGLLLL